MTGRLVLSRRGCPAPDPPHTTRHRADGGSATAELVLVAPTVLVLLLFVVFCGRLTDTRLRLDDAAHASARAASLARTPAAATADARTTADAALADAGVACQRLAVDTDTGGLRPGATVTVTISCTVQLEDLALLGVPGTTTLHAQFASPADIHRGEGRGFAISEAPSDGT